jgi:trans-2,3-dihydro-3-hydroxyanthranilate isomerase
VNGRARFHLLDVFTHRRFGGKPLALVADADALAPAQMREIARELNQPVTAFLRAPRDPVNSARLQLFSAQNERPFAAHAAIGAAVLLAQSRAPEILAQRGVVVVLEIGAEAFACEVIRNRGGVAYAQLALLARPERRPDCPGAEALAQASSLTPQDVGFPGHEPRFWGSDAPIVCAPVRDRDALQRARPSAHFSQIFGESLGLFLYTADTLAPDAHIHARLFDAAGAEDPANGEALAAFAASAVEFERPENGEHEIFIEQGHMMARHSRLTLRLGVADGALASVQIGGQAVVVAQGELTL